MSVRIAIRAALSAGTFRPLQPSLASDPTRRLMLLGAELVALLDGGQKDDRTRQLRAELEAFVKGEEIAVSPTPYRHGNAYMGLLAPEHEGVWEIRSRRHRPGMRVFGRFAEQDVFVALTWGIRSVPDSRWPEKAPLGKGTSKEFECARLTVIDLWKGLFGAVEPLHGGDIGELLSDKYNRV